MRRLALIAVSIALVAAGCASPSGGKSESLKGPFKERSEGELEARYPGTLDLGAKGLKVGFSAAGISVAPPNLDQAVATGTTAFVNYPAPSSAFTTHSDAGETSIGSNPLTGAAMFQMSLNTAKVTWDNAAVPNSNWLNVSPTLTRFVSLDPMLFTDTSTGRTYVNQLEGEASVMAYTDNDGANWTNTQPVTVGPSFDHQSIASGPYASPAPATAALSGGRAVYYCAQGAALSQCARSDTGGLTWGPGLAMNTGACGGLHGRPLVDPDGSVYVPHRSCSGPTGRVNGVYVSRDNGLTWKLSLVAGTVPGRGDPGLSQDASGRLYLISSTNGHPMVATSTDGARTWSAPVRVDANFDINNAEFTMATAGTGGRAAVAWIGTTTSGNDQASTFAGVWHLYVATTIDSGATWETVDLTPTDPVQRGCVWMGGGSNPCRNLLDFQGITTDRDGRVLVGYADGCIGTCVNDAASTAKASYGTIARQVSGPRLKG